MYHTAMTSEAQSGLLLKHVANRYTCRCTLHQFNEAHWTATKLNCTNTATGQGPWSDKEPHHKNKTIANVIGLVEVAYAKDT